MPLRTQKYRVRHSLCMSCSIKFNSIDYVSAMRFVTRINKRVYRREFICKNSFSSRSQGNFVIVIDNNDGFLKYKTKDAREN